MFYFSKSKYCGLWQCPKIAWLMKYKPEERVLDDSAISRMKTGNEVGDLAMGLFGDYVEVTSYKEDKLDLREMVAKTRREMEKGTSVICEASFSYEGMYCAVDILKKEGDGWSIYEVKSSAMHQNQREVKPVYIADMAYQKYILEQCGVRVTGTYLVCINGDYLFDGVLDLQQLFITTDVSALIGIEEKNVADNLAMAQNLLAYEQEPPVDLSERCQDPYLCGFWGYCTRHLPSPSVFDLYRMPFKKKIEYYQKGESSFQALQGGHSLKSEKQLRQIEYALQDKGTYVEKEKIREFLKTLSYPLYFLDFETMQPVIPICIGTRPYAQIPFQYSLHYVEKEGGELKHKEFLAESGTDSRRALAEQLCEDIPANVCVLAYNMKFERGRIQELAEAFPDLATHLLSIRDRMKDLLVPFQSGFYYNRAMGGSFSIKSVLPAMFPGDPSLDYHHLEGVHNGSEAMDIFPQIQHMCPEEQRKARQNLLKYCELDTYAMVKIWEELRSVAAE